MSPVFGTYEIIEKIAQGAMGEIYHVRSKDGEEYAIKSLKQQAYSSDNEESKLRFQREMELSAKIDHPNIAKVHETNLDGDPPYMVMDFYPKGSLQELLQNEKMLGPTEVLKIAKDVTTALKEIHRIEIVHRDIKPGNILVGEDSYLLTDLGLARLLDAEKSDEKNDLTMSQTALGTPHYIAPEQAMNASSVDIRSDIYSLGATLYHCLTGFRVHEGTSSLHVMMKHIQDPVKFPTEVEKNLPESLIRVVMKMLEKSVVDRYQTPQELIDELEAISEEDGTIKEQLEEAKPKNKMGMIMFMSFLLLLIVAGGGVLKMACLPPSTDDPYYKRDLLAIETVVEDYSSKALTAKVEQLEAFLEKYPRDLKTTELNRAIELGKRFSTESIYSLTVNAVGNFKDARSFELRIFVGEQKLQVTSKVQKTIFYANEKFQFRWQPSTKIRLELEEFEWFNDFVFNEELTSAMPLRDLSGKHFFKVSGKAKSYFENSELLFEGSFDGISEKDWQLFFTYFRLQD